MVQETESPDRTLDGVTAVTRSPVRPPSSQEEERVDTAVQAASTTPPSPLPVDPEKSSVISTPEPAPHSVPPVAFDGPDIDEECNMHLMLSDTGPREKPFKPCHMFFYGSLMDPEVLQGVLRLPDLPTTTPATIDGYKIKMWGIYPTLVPAHGNVSGVVWKLGSEEHFKRLVAYETHAYTWSNRSAMLQDGIVLSDCRIFVWAGSPDDEELEEGDFDLELYQMYFKPSAFRRH